MNKQTKITIEKDNYSELSYDRFIEDINYIVNEIEVYCEISNGDYSNIIEEQKRYDYYPCESSIVIEVNAVGYCQSEWQRYKLYIGEHTDNDIEILTNLLKRSFTHFNDYIVTKTEVVDIDGTIYESGPIDYTNFDISHIEFPNEQDIENEYLEIYGKDYDLISINNE